MSLKLLSIFLYVDTLNCVNYSDNNTDSDLMFGRLYCNSVAKIFVRIWSLVPAYMCHKGLYFF